MFRTNFYVALSGENGQNTKEKKRSSLFEFEIIY